MFYRSEKLRAIIVAKGLMIGKFCNEFSLAGYQGRFDCHTLSVRLQPAMGARRAPKICDAFTPQVWDPDILRAEGCHKRKIHPFKKLSLSPC
ncbi:hypothetical protein [Qipengyuania flava]|uniref:hypothetical protein n=1 Tax=Qipengyuania flava TaxID=192812 RepID=UPI003BB0799B